MGDGSPPHSSCPSSSPSCFFSVFPQPHLLLPLSYSYKRSSKLSPGCWHVFICLPEVPTWIQSQLPPRETCSQTHPSLASLSSSTRFSSPLLGLPRISFQVSSLFLNPCLGVCYWGNLSLNLRILTQRAARCPPPPSLTTYQDGHSVLVCLGVRRRVHAHSTSGELAFRFLTKSKIA